MISTVLFDLDDTLLGNDMDTFLPQYFGVLEAFAVRELGVRDFMPSVIKASEVMVRNTDPRLTNNEVFWREIDTLIGLDRVKAEPLFNEFYLDEFNQLQGMTTFIPAAADLIQNCFHRGYKVVIATNPMFPRTAVDARLRWAGIPADDFRYTLVTSIENMHATKPHQEYYREILAMVNSTPQEAIMVGDDWQRDIEPAAALGISTYWIQLPGATLPDPLIPAGYGSLEGLLAQIESGWLDRLPLST